MAGDLFDDDEDGAARGAELDASMPIVNIVLLLILFFLATGRLLNPSEYDVTPPETTELPYDQLPQPLLVVREDDTWELNQVSIQPENLGAAINAFPETDQVLHILMGAERSAAELLNLLNNPALEDLEIRLVTLHSGGRG